MIKRYFIVVLLLFLFPAGVSAQRRPAAKKDWKAKYDYVGAAHDGRILVHRGGEGSDPRMGRFYTDGCFGYTDTCGTVVIPLIYDYADSFSNGFAVVGKGEKNDRRFGLIDRQGREVVLALGATVEAETTGALVRSLVNRRFPGVTVTRLAQGIPLGAEVKFMDRETLRQSLQ